MSFLTTIFDCVENHAIKKMGGYRKAAQIRSNIALLHEMQDSGMHYNDFIEEEEYATTYVPLETLLKPKKKKSVEVDMTGEKPE